MPDFPQDRKFFSRPWPLLGLIALMATVAAGAWFYLTKPVPTTKTPTPQLITKVVPTAVSAAVSTMAVGPATSTHGSLSGGKGTKACGTIRWKDLTPAEAAALPKDLCVHFATNSAALTASAKSVVRQNARFLEGK